MPKGTAEPDFAGAGSPGDDQVLVRFQPVSLRKRQDITPVDAAMCGKIDILDLYIAKAQFCTGEAVGQSPVGTTANLAIKHQSEPFLPIQRPCALLLGNVTSRRRHAGSAEDMHLVEG